MVVLEAITRKASVKMAKNLVANTQQEYVQAELKARAQEDTVRKINQIQANRDMDVSLCTCSDGVDTLGTLLIASLNFSEFSDNHNFR